MMKKRILSVLAACCMAAASLPPFAANAANEVEKAVESGSWTEDIAADFSEADDISGIRNTVPSMNAPSGGCALTKTDGNPAPCLLFDGVSSLSFGINRSGSIVSYEADVNFQTLAEGVSVFDAKVAYSDGSGEGWAINGIKSVKYLGRYYFDCYGRTSVKITAGRWYNVRAVVKQGTNGYVNYYIDGSLVKTQKLTPPPKKISVIEISGASGGKMLFDNFKVKTYMDSIFDSTITRNPALSQRPSMERIASDFGKSGVHPRLMATKADFERLRTEVQTNPDKKAWYEALMSKAKQLLYSKTLVYELRDGVRLMYVSSELEQRMAVLAMAYRLTGEAKYAQKAYLDLEAVANFSDWHPSHHIDVGIMAAGFAIGYDWLYDTFTEAQRKTLEDGMKKNGFKDIILSYQTTESDMTNAAYVQDNHNAMCNGGAMLAALAFYDVFPTESRYIIANATRGMEEMMWRYAPDGAWFEGVMYGSICVNYLSMAFSSMEICLGTIYGLDEAEGFDKAYDYIENTQSKTAVYNFGDSDFMKRAYCYSGWLNKHFGKSTACDLSGSFTTIDGEQLAFALLWNSSNSGYDVPRDVLYNSDDAKTKLLLMRGETNGETFVGIKAGDTVCEHSQLDGGSFVFDSQGVRWACDMGKDDYNLPNFFDTAEGRWKIFLNRAEAHNTVVINPKTNGGADYSLNSEARFSDVIKTDSGAVAAVDMTELLSGRAESARRGFCFTDNRQSLVVRDELNIGTAAKDIYWLFYTKADFRRESENRAVLTDRSQPEKKLIIDFLCNDGENNIPFDLVFEQAAEMMNRGVSGQSANDGYHRLALKTSASGNVNITVKLTPVNVNGDSVEKYDVPINTWSEQTVNAASAVLEPLSAADSGSAKVICNYTFDNNADISNPNKSMLRVNERTVPRFNYSMNTYGESDVATVVEEASGNRLVRMTSNSENSVYEKLHGRTELVFCDLDTVRKKGKIIKYSVDLKFPDFLQDKYIYETKYINGQGTTTWFASECMMVIPYGGNADEGVLCINDNQSEYLSFVEKDVWHNYSVEYDCAESEIRFYFDGELVASRAAANGISEILKANIKNLASDIDSVILLDNYKCVVYPYPTVRLDCFAANGIMRAEITADCVATFCIASYNERGEMSGVKTWNIEKGVTLSDYEYPEAAEVRAFLWKRGTAVPMLGTRSK